MADPLIYEFLRKRLKALRGQCDLTQESVAELAGISVIYYQSIEAARRKNISILILEKLAGVYGLKTHEILSPKMPKIKKLPGKIPPPHYRR